MSRSIRNAFPIFRRVSSEIQLGHAEFIEIADAFGLTDKILKNALSFLPAFLRHIRQIGNTDDPDSVADLDSSSINILFPVHNLDRTLLRRRGAVSDVACRSLFGIVLLLLTMRFKRLKNCSDRIGSESDFLKLVCREGEIRLAWYLFVK